MFRRCRGGRLAGVCDMPCVEKHEVYLSSRVEAVKGQEVPVGGKEPITS